MGKRFGNFRYWTGWIQVIIWVFIYSVPIWSMISADKFDFDGVLVWSCTCSSWLLMYYLNYFLYIPRILFKKHTRRFVLLNILTAVGILVALEVGSSFIGDTPEIKLEDVDIAMLVVSFFAFLLTYLFLTLAAISVRSLQRNKEMEQQKERADREQSRMELERLKSQLNPHFLFNSLNNISALSAIDAEAAQQAIETLSSMLRYVLYDTAAPLVSYRDEMQFIRNYISLMRLRYTDKLQLKFSDTSGVAELTQLPPMLFISLVENAFKYGASSTQSSRIEIEVSSPEAGRLTMKIVNTLLTPGVSGPAEQVRPEKHGVGLKNLRRRLELLFPTNHTLSYGVNKEGMYEVIITIPYESN